MAFRDWNVIKNLSKFPNTNWCIAFLNCFKFRIEVSNWLNDQFKYLSQMIKKFVTENHNKLLLSLLYFPNQQKRNFFHFVCPSTTQKTWLIHALKRTLFLLHYTSIIKTSLFSSFFLLLLCCLLLSCIVTSYARIFYDKLISILSQNHNKSNNMNEKLMRYIITKQFFKARKQYK